MIRGTPLAAGLLVAVTALSACGDEAPVRDAARRAAGDGTLGGGAQTVTLARLDGVERPERRVAWTAWRVDLAAGEVVRHRHGTATIFAEVGEHRLRQASRTTALEAGDGAAVADRVPHRHEATAAGRSVFSEVVLANPGARLPRVPRARRLFQSDVLRGIPSRARLQFIEVRLAPGAETSVHTHPGPEFIVATKGRFDYENGIEGERRFKVGDTAGIPPDTPVQKRNDTRREAAFLSWFLVDPDEPFAPAARFARSGR